MRCRASVTSVPPAREVLDQLDPQLLGWVEAQWGTEVADADRLAGGVTSTMLRLTGVDDNRAVLRLMTEEPWRRHGEGLLAREAEIQRFLEATAVPAPRSLAVDPCGVATGVPVHLMSFVPGTVDLTRSDEAFLDAVSETLSAIQALDPPSRPREFQTWAPTSKWIVPEWAGDAGLWRSSAVTPSAELLQIDGGWRHGPDQPLLSTSVDIMQLIGTLNGGRARRGLSGRHRICERLRRRSRDGGCGRSDRSRDRCRDVHCAGRRAAA
jgi:Phosphotransferase enzyme family